MECSLWIMTKAKAKYTLSLMMIHFKITLLRSQNVLFNFKVKMFVTAYTHNKILYNFEIVHNSYYFNINNYKSIKGKIFDE